MKTHIKLTIILLFCFLSKSYAQWNILEANPPTNHVYGVKKFNGNYFTTTSKLPFRSTDGLSWEMLPITNISPLLNPPRFFSEGDDYLFYSGREKLYRADDNSGENFSIVLDYPVHELAVKNNNTILAYTFGSSAKFHISLDGGITWSTQETDFESMRGMTVYQDEFWMRSHQKVHKINIDFEVTSYNIPDDIAGRKIINYQNNLIINNTNSWDDAPGLHYSNDGGVTWQAIPSPQEGFVEGFAISGNKFYILIGYTGTNETDSGIYVSEDPLSGTNWEKLAIDVKHYTELSYNIDVYDNEIFIDYGERTLLKSSNSGMNWETASSGIYGTKNSTSYFWVEDHIWFFNGYYSTNLGKNWDLYLSNLTDSIGGILTDNYFRINETTILAGGRNSGWRSEDNGQSWNISSGVSRYFLADTNKLYATLSSSAGKLRRSDDLGNTWSNLRSLDYAEDFWSKGDTILVTDKTKAIRSIDDGLTWEVVYSDPSIFYSLGDLQNITEIGDLLFLAKSGFHVSEDWGATWTEQPNNLTGFNDIKEIHTVDNFLIGLSSNRVFLSADTASTWIDITLNLRDGPIENSSLLYGYYTAPYFVVQKLHGTVGVLKISDLVCFGSSDLTDCFTLSGNIYEEENQNCEKDSTEANIEAAIVKITPGPYYTATDLNGNYSIQLASGNHSVSINAPGYEPEVICPDDPNTYTNFDLDSTSVLNFGLIPLDTNDLEINLTSGFARFGTVMRVNIQLNNLGWQESSGEIQIEFDQLKLAFIDTLNNEAAQISENQLSLSYHNLSPQTGLYSPLYFRVIGLFDNPACIEAAVFPEVEDDFPDNNQTRKCPVIISSYDPNDKLVFPKGNITPDQTSLEYTIRFQNTGNDTAFLVRIVDTLQAPLDPFTLRNIAASHPYTFAIKGPGIVEWTFADILLPDSTTNLIASQGFIKFMINFQNELTIDQVIENKAAIYFDFNEPVITNTIESLVADFTINTTTLSEHSNTLNLYPNPSENFFHVDFPQLIERGDLNIFNLKGQIVEKRKIRNSNFAKVDARHYAKGLYFVELYSGPGEILRGKIVVQ